MDSAVFLPLKRKMDRYLNSSSQKQKTKSDLLWTQFTNENLTEVRHNLFQKASQGILVGTMQGKRLAFFLKSPLISILTLYRVVHLDFLCSYC